MLTERPVAPNRADRDATGRFLAGNGVAVMTALHYDIVNEADLQDAVRKLAAARDDSNKSGRVVDMTVRR